MFNPRCIICVMFLGLIACGEKPVAVTELASDQNVSVSGSVDESKEVSIGKVDDTKESSAQLSAPEPTRDKELDLSLPSDMTADAKDWEEVEKGRYGVESWFEQSGQSEDKRLKLKTKLRMKDGAEFDKSSNLSNYGDSVDGAEVGFEYKTR